MFNLEQRRLFYYVNVFTSRWPRTNLNSLIPSRFLLSFTTCFTTRNNEFLNARVMKRAWLLFVSRWFKFDAPKLTENFSVAIKRIKIRGCSTPLIQENANINREWFLSCLILLYRGTGSLGLHVARLVFNTGRLQCEFVCLALYAQR